MVNVRGMEPSGAAINPARDSAGQTESAGYKGRKVTGESKGQGRRRKAEQEDSRMKNEDGGSEARKESEPTPLASSSWFLPPLLRPPRQSFPRRECMRKE